MLRLLTLGMFFIPLFAHAFDPFIVKDIRVEGIQRVEAGTIFSYLPVKVGEKVDDEKAAAAVRALFATGFFKDVRLEVDRDVLIVVVEERPAISSIEFAGLKEFEKDAILKAFKEVGLAESRIFDRAVLDRAEQELKRQYLNRGKYGVAITTTVTPLERNRVGVNFSITEGDAAKIQSINIIGNQAFGEKELLAQFSITTPGWLTWYTKTDQYSKQKLSADLETLRSYYSNRGYLDFNIESTQVSISPDKKGIYITVALVEGEKYTVSEIKVGGQMLLPEPDVRALITLKPGDTFSRELLNESVKKIADRLGNDGYAFANVNPVPETNKDKRQVAFNFLIDPGRRVYVRRINVAGNTRTRDEVIRREMRQLEGAYYDTDKLQKSKQRLDRLGFFSEVDVETPPVPGSPDQVDATIKVKEKPTGAFLVGAGFSSTEKLTVSTSVSQDNIFGSGKAVSAAINSSKSSKTYSLSQTDPYYTVDGVGRGFDLYTRTTDAARLGLGDYNTTSTGGGVRFGYPLTAYDRLSFGLAVDATKINLGNVTTGNVPQRYTDYVKTFGATTTSLVTTGGWGRDNRDSILWPTKGERRSIGIEATAPPGKLRYYKISASEQIFYTFGRDYTVMLSGEVGVGNGYTGKPLPFFRNYYAGGMGSLRGYQASSLGPRDANGAFLGGNRKLVGSAEFLFPLPGSGRDRQFRLSTFIDGGQVFEDGKKIALSDVRYTAGFGAFWSSPMGPLKVSYGRPLNEKSGDMLQKFQFTFGQTF